MEKNILITGEPRSGKSTLFEKVLDKTPNKRGFHTREVRRDGLERTGFQVVTDDGWTVPLANIYLSTPYRVSRYGVNVSGFKKIIEPLFLYDEDKLLYIDEIGEMELLSNRFQELVTEYLNAENPFLGTISKVYSNDFTEEIKRRDDVTLIELTQGNIDKVYRRVLNELREFIPRLE
jgi:nucleoside-triphosphatase THEP1